MRRTPFAIVAVSMVLATFGCGKDDDGDKNKGNPITNAKGPIGQGGDPGAMAMRRGAQQTDAVNQLRAIGQLYNTYRIDAATPTSDGFIKYLEQSKDLPAAFHTALKEGRYVIQVPPGGTGVLAYEKDKDYQNTRVVVMTDGAVTKTMPEADFQAALKKGQ
jgi:hypothetical protein